jgi:hypothetical protein
MRVTLLPGMRATCNLLWHHLASVVNDEVMPDHVRLRAIMTRRDWHSAFVLTTPRCRVQYLSRPWCLHANSCSPQHLYWLCRANQFLLCFMHRCWTWTSWMQEMLLLTPSGSDMRCGSVSHACIVDEWQCW